MLQTGLRNPPLGSCKKRTNWRSRGHSLVQVRSIECALTKRPFDGAKKNPGLSLQLPSQAKHARKAMKISHPASAPLRFRAEGSLERLVRAAKTPGVADMLKFLFHPVALAAMLFLVGAWLA